MKRLDRDDTTGLMRMRAMPLAFGFAALAVAAAVLVAHVAWYYALITAVIIFLFVLLVPERIVSGSGAAFSRVYSPTGSSTPSQQQYSLADSLLARGKVEEAAEAYRALSADFPQDSEPLIRLARLWRDHNADYAEAAACYDQALQLETIPAGKRAAVMRELIELYTHKMQRPALALPYLARFAEEFPAHPAAGWAQREYNEIKATRAKFVDE